LTTAELSQALFPDGAEPNLDLQTLHEILPFWWDKLSKVSWQKIFEDFAE
jgi:hypothetical protein